MLDTKGTIVHSKKSMHDLVSETWRLAKASKLPVADICAAADIKRRWYAKFKAGEFKDPGVSKALRPHKALSQKRAA